MVLLLRRNVVDLPTDYFINYYRCSGFMMSAFMVVQVIAGVILLLLYVADLELSVRCVMNLSNDSFLIEGCFIDIFEVLLFYLFNFLYILFVPYIN